MAQSGSHWARVLAPAAVLVGLAGLDHWAGSEPSLGGIVTGMGLMALLVALLAWGRQTLRPLPQALQAALLGVTETALGVVLLFLLAAPLTLLLPQPWALGLLGTERAADLMVTLLLGVGLLVAARALWRAGAQAALRAEAERDAALVRAELSERERELVQADLQLLRAQVEPHFLWNTLANVEYLMRHRPDTAREMLGQLIVYLRANVATGDRQYSTLGSEFESVRAYLGLMQLRMGERLRFELQLPEALRELEFPPLMLQTLVENAIKHGLEPKQGNVLLTIRGSTTGKTPAAHCIEVQDNGVGLQPNPSTRGTRLGLRNVRERLRALYGGAAALSIVGIEAGGVCARIEWPSRSRT